jgi:hypothetical protein
VSRRSITAILLVSTLALACTALAHMVQFPRFVHVRVEPEKLAVAVAVQQHAGADAGRMRTRFDHDADGRLSQVEQDGLASWLGASSRAGLTLSLDGVELLTEPESGTLELETDAQVGAGDGYAFRSVVGIAVVLLPGKHTLTIADRPDNPRRVLPLRLDLPPGWTVVEARAEGEATPLVEARLGSWQGAFAGEGGRLVADVLVPPRGGAEQAGTLGSDASDDP